MRSIKKYLAGIMLFSLSLVLLLSSCSGTGTPNSEKPDQTTKANQDNDDESLYPDELVIYSWLSEHLSKTGAKDNNANAAYQELEKVTGTKVTWQHPAAGGDAATQFNVMITSGEYPDIIMTDWPNVAGGVDSYVEDGVIIRLTELLDEHMPNVSNLLDERDSRSILTYNEDDIYYIPEIRKEASLSVFLGPIIRGDWLDELDLETPKTLDQLYETLKSIKEDKPQSLGMSGAGFSGGIFPVGNLLWPFGITYGMYQVDGTVKYGPLQDEFKDAMAYIHKLYTEGLLDPDYTIQERDALDSKFMNDQVAYEYGIQPSKMNNAMADTDFRAEGIDHLRLTEDAPAYVFDVNYISYLNTGSSIAISTNAEDPTKVARWIDYIFSEEGAMLTNYGVEGQSYNMVDGKVEYTEEYKEDSIDNWALYHFGSMSTFPSLRFWDTYSESLHPVSKVGIENWSTSADTSRVLPPLTLTTEEQQTITDKFTDINTMIDEQFDNLVNGNTSLDEIPAIQERLIKMGIEDVIAVYQAALDRTK